MLGVAVSGSSGALISGRDAAVLGIGESALAGKEALLSTLGVDGLGAAHLGLAVGSLEGGLVILRLRKAISNFSHSSWHADGLHQILLIWHHGLDLVEGAGEVVEEAGHLEDLVTGGSLRGSDLEAALEDLLHILRVVVGKGIVFSRKYLGVEALHGLSSEWRELHDHFVQNAAG